VWERCASQRSDGFGFAPRLLADGPLDSAVDAEVADHLLAVVRESLSNAARHAHCRTASVTVTVADGQVRAEIVDDGVGVGVGEPARSSGLANMRSRAAELRGAFQIGPGPDGTGTLVRWTAPCAAPATPSPDPV